MVIVSSHTSERLFDSGLERFVTDLMILTEIHESAHPCGMIPRPVRPRPLIIGIPLEERDDVILVIVVAPRPYGDESPIKFILTHHDRRIHKSYIVNIPCMSRVLDPPRKKRRIQQFIDTDRLYEDAWYRFFDPLFFDLQSWCMRAGEEELVAVGKKLYYGFHHAFPIHYYEKKSILRVQRIETEDLTYLVRFLPPNQVCHTRACEIL